MAVFVFIMLIIMGCMWMFGRFMYPRPPKSYLMPRADDDVTLRTCDFCGHSLPQYRGIVSDTPSGTHFFCNAEHEADYLAGKKYQPYQEKL